MSKSKCFIENPYACFNLQAQLGSVSFPHSQDYQYFQRRSLTKKDRYQSCYFNMNCYLAPDSALHSAPYSKI